jgi:cold shock CspA family protein
MPNNYTYVHSVINVQFFSDCRELVTFQLSNQPDLVAVLKSFADMHKKVPGVVKYKEPTFEAGTVKWFNPVTLNGIIVDKGGDVHFHYNDIINFSSWRRIKPGTRVTYNTWASGRVSIKKNAFWITIK